jgi:hypothetical protein
MNLILLQRPKEAGPDLRKKGGEAYVVLPRKGDIEEDTVRSYLRREGLTEEEILRFIGAAKS